MRRILLHTFEDFDSKEAGPRTNNKCVERVACDGEHAKGRRNERERPINNSDRNSEKEAEEAKQDAPAQKSLKEMLMGLQ